jgi:uncharacterized membrane protein
MGAIQDSQGRDVGPAAAQSMQKRRRLVGIDAARGLALVGMIAIHILPDANEETHEPTLAWILFAGDSAALFALLAGVGLALSSGGYRPHTGRRMAGDRLGLAVRAVLIAAIALAIAPFLQQEDPPAYGILIYYSVFFLLAIPFLHLRPRTLFISAAAFGIISPILLQKLDPVLPTSSTFNPAVGHFFFEPAGVASDLLLTGSYPALPYMCYILTGMGIGRLDLRQLRIQGYIAAVGAGLAIFANAASAILLYAMGGFEQLVATSGMTEGELDNGLVYGPGIIPDTSAWWLAIATPHSNMPLAIASSLGLGLLATGLFLLAERAAVRLLAPLAAMGSMTLTLYSAHLLALSPEVHYEAPFVWYVVHLSVALAFGVIWRRWMGQGPLERPVAAAAKNFGQIMDDGSSGSTAASGTAPR